jgi:DNA replication and repair protein RecF
MHVSELSVRDFRSYAEVTVRFEPGINVLVGTNGQGKTNLVEALSYLATFSSHRVASDAPLVRQHCPSAGVKVSLMSDGRELTLEIEINPGKANKAKLNGSPVPKSRDVLGALLTVVFAPEDLMLVKGDPSERRKFMDETLILLTPSFAGIKSDFEKILRQRNALLKSAYGNRNSADVMRTLDVWDAQLARTGAIIMSQRMQMIDQLRGHVENAYFTVSDDRGPFEIAYETALEFSTPTPSVELVEAALLEGLARRRKDELDRGVTLVGPHRDELVLQLRGLPVRGYASHGESWSCALALKLGVFQLLRTVSRHGDPVLILDDVFAELDEIRRRKLVELVQGVEQTLVTAAVAQDVPEDLDGARFDVHEGSVNRVT